MTKKAEQDAFYAQEMMSRFVPEQERAIMAHFESTTLATPLRLVFLPTLTKLLMASSTAGSLVVQALLSLLMTLLVLASL